jgi:glutamyl-tRNA reductase
MQRYAAIGCDHLCAGPEEIGRAQLPVDGLSHLLPAIKRSLGADELVYLATCHRAEWYFVYEGEQCSGRMLMTLAKVLPELTSGAVGLPDLTHCRALGEQSAARHLFRVASALESMMVGDNQILGQVKEALRRASELGLAGPLMTTLFTQAFRAAKRVRTETTLTRGAVSLVSLAERYLRDRLVDNPGPVAIVGAGEIAAFAVKLVRALDERRAIVVFNRGRERGEALATQIGATYRPLEALGRNGDRFAAVIAGASAPEPIIGPDLAARLAPTLLLDLGMPPVVAADCGVVAGIERVDQRTLRGEAEVSRSARQAEIGKGEAIVEEQLRDLEYELMEVGLSPVARRLMAHFREAVRAELERVANGDVAPRESEMEAAVERLSQRLVRMPLRGLREVAWHHSPEVLETFLAAVEQ